MRKAALLLLVLSGGAGHAHAQQSCDTTRYRLATPTGRFVDHADGTQTDTRSNLMWLTCSSGQTWSKGECTGTARELTWQGANEFAAKINADASHFFKDWRVPDIRDLASIAEPQCRNPRINLIVFPNTPSATFWSATERRGSEATLVYVLSFGPEGVGYDDKQLRHYVRLVRNAP
jgi:Protein of unknown function (DUF1566)